MGPVPRNGRRHCTGTQRLSEGTSVDVGPVCEKRGE